MKTTPSTSLTSIDHRLAAYAAVATAALAAPILPTAEAAVVYSGPVNINIPSNLNGVYLNVVTGANSTSNITGYDINPYSSTNLNMFLPTTGAAVGTGTNYFNLAPGTLISAASTFAASGVTTPSGLTPLNTNSSLNYVGFRFINEAAGNQLQYGWLQIMLSSTSTSQPRTIIGYAFENTGGGLLAGFTGAAVPENVNTGVLLALVATGVFGVRIWRQRKAA